MTTTDFNKHLSGGHALTLDGHIRMGASWDVSSRGKGGLKGMLSRFVGADIDAVALVVENGQPTALAGLGNNDPLGNGSVLHSGDNQNGKADGDDEVIDLHLGRITPAVQKIYLAVTAFKKINEAWNKLSNTSGFGGADNVKFKIYDMAVSGTTPLFEVKPSMLTTQNTWVMAVLTPKAGASGFWEMEKVDKYIDVKYDSRDDLVTQIMSTR